MHTKPEPSSRRAYVPWKFLIVTLFPSIFVNVTSTHSLYVHAWCNDLFTANDGIVIAVGHIDSGKSATVCKVGGEFWLNETGHAHPYIAPDGSRVFFVSTRTGLPQVYEAKLPEGFLDALTS